MDKILLSKNNIDLYLEVTAKLDHKALHKLDYQIEKVKQTADKIIDKIRRGQSPKRISDIRQKRDKIIKKLEDKKRALHEKHEKSFGRRIEKGISKLKGIGKKSKEIAKTVGVVVGATAAIGAIGAATVGAIALKTYISYQMLPYTLPILGVGFAANVIKGIKNSRR